jgi:hypothetical protein
VAVSAPPVSLQSRPTSRGGCPSGLLFPTLRRAIAGVVTLFVVSVAVSAR